MNNEMKQLVEDAAKLLGLEVVDWRGNTPVAADNQGLLTGFNPLDPERGDLMKVAEAARLVFGRGLVLDKYTFPDVQVEYKEGDHQSKVLAILRAASSVLRSK